MSQPATPWDAVFDALRPRLFSIAYRMLGIRADAEDVVQDAWLRWSASDRASLQSPEAWLVTVATRLSIDRLRAAKSERDGAQAIVALCVGGMVLARTTDDPDLRKSLRSAARTQALGLLGEGNAAVA